MHGQRHQPFYYPENQVLILLIDSKCAQKKGTNLVPFQYLNT